MLAVGVQQPNINLRIVHCTLIYSDEGLTLETSASQSHCGPVNIDNEHNPIGA